MTPPRVHLPLRTPRGTSRTFFRENYGPTFTAFRSLDRDGQEALAQDLVELVREFNRLSEGGRVACDADYLEIVATRS